MGNTGHCGTSHIPKSEWNQLDYRAKGYGAHLHLQMFLTESAPDYFIKEDMNFSKLKNIKEGGYDFECKNHNIVNPFDYSETYEKDTKK